MDTVLKTRIMQETAQHLVNMIQKRLTSRLNALSALQGTPMDDLPDEVKKMREVEASAIRAVMQEQVDLIEIINMLFPQAVIAQPANKGKKSNAKN